jgi:hypothetical protein
VVAPLSPIGEMTADAATSAGYCPIHVPGDLFPRADARICAAPSAEGVRKILRRQRPGMVTPDVCSSKTALSDSTTVVPAKARVRTTGFDA